MDHGFQKEGKSEQCMEVKNETCPHLQIYG